MGYIYLIQDLDKDTYKIGVTKNINKRIKTLQTANSSELKLIETFETNYPYRLESMLHRKFQYQKAVGEWFYLSYEEVKEFKHTCEFHNNIILSMLDNPFFNKNLH